MICKKYVRKYQICSALWLQVIPDFPAWDLEIPHDVHETLSKIRAWVWCIWYRYGTDMVQIWYSIWVGGNNLWTIMNQPPWFARYALPERPLTAIMADQMPIRKVDVQLAGYSWIVSRQYPNAALNTAGYLLILDTSYNSANSLHQVTGSSRTVWEYLGYLGYCLMNVLPGLWKQLHVNSVHRYFLHFSKGILTK